MSATFDPYAALGVPPDASSEQIRSAFRRAVRREHPDVKAPKGGDEAAVREVMAAYELLSNAATRAAYDARRAGDPPQHRKTAVPVNSSSAPGARPAGAPCRRCRGRKIITRNMPCPACGATGTTVALDVGSVSYEPCSRCRGQRRVDMEVGCDDCGGTGRKPGTQ